MPETFPCQSGVRGKGARAASNTANLMLDEPQLSTRTRRADEAGGAEGGVRIIKRSAGTGVFIVVDGEGRVEPETIASGMIFTRMTISEDDNAHDAGTLARRLRPDPTPP